MSLPQATRAKVLDAYYAAWQDDQETTLTPFQIQQRTEVALGECQCAVNELYADGFLELVDHVRPDGGWTGYRYRPLAPPAAALDLSLGPRSRLSPLATA